MNSFQSFHTKSFKNFHMKFLKNFHMKFFQSKINFNIYATFIAIFIIGLWNCFGKFLVELKIENFSCLSFVIFLMWTKLIGFLGFVKQIFLFISV